MINQDPLLVTLVKLIDSLPAFVPATATAAKRGRGRPQLYSDRLILKALIIMIVRHIHTVHNLLEVLQQPTAEMQALRTLLTDHHGHFPSRRTWERRLKQIPASLPDQIAQLGHHLVALLEPWAEHGRGVAIDSTLLRANGGVWHQKDRQRDEVPHTSIDTEAHWTKSGWHGWVYGWKLHLVTTVAQVWLPLAARLMPANLSDSEVGVELIKQLPQQARFILGDRHYRRAEIEQVCSQSGRLLVTTKYGKYPHPDEGVEVRRVFHKLRSVAIENFNEHYKAIFDAHGQVPTKGRVNTQRFALGAVWLYQLVLLYRFEQGLDLRQGLKAFIKAA